MNCFIYCRKSSEDKSRQVQSIGDQKKIMSKIARSRGLKIRKIFVDEKSAGKPYQRPAFKEMIKRVHTGEATIILSWKIDRLSRNPVENGQLSWMLQNNIIKEIITAERSYLPQDNVLLFVMEGAMANQYLRDLSANVKRGMSSKVEKGIFPGSAPLGYLNHSDSKGNKTIIADSFYFPLVKRLWRLLVSEQYQLADLYRIMTEKYPLFNKGKSHKGKPIAFSTFHRMFHNPFYCGLFKWGDELHLGIHEKMLTQSEFERVQQFLNTKEKTRKRELVFDYKGVFSCGTCQAKIATERKTKFIIKTQSKKSFDYYRCVHRKRNIECKEKPLSKKQIEEQLATEIKRLYLPEQVIDFGMCRLGEQKGSETQLQAATSFNLQREIQSLSQQKLQIEDNIVLEADIEIRSLMKRKYEKLKITIQKLRENYDKLQDEITNNHFDIIKALEVIKNAQNILKLGTIQQKKQLLNNLGTNWKIKDKTLHFKPHFVVEAVLKTKEFIRLKKRVSEPTLNSSQIAETLTHEDIRFVWLTLWEFIRNSKE